MKDVIPLLVYLGVMYDEIHYVLYDSVRMSHLCRNNLLNLWWTLVRILSFVVDSNTIVMYSRS